jgi:hypothetical protein
MTRKWGLAVGALTLPMIFLFEDRGRGLAACTSSAAILLVTRHLWDLRSRVWFWVTLAAVVLAHAYFVVSFPWPTFRQLGPYGLFPILLFQFFLILGAFGLVERVMLRLAPSGDEQGLPQRPELQRDGTESQAGDRRGT